MRLDVTTYISGDSFVHRLDARVKIVLLLVYSVCLFFIDTWAGMACAAVLFVCALIASGIPFGRVFRLIIPVYVLVALVVLFNMFVFATPDMLGETTGGAYAPVSGVYPLIGSFSFTLTGLFRGLFYAVRILLLIFMSLIVTFSTTSAALIEALNWFMHPLAHLRVPTDDVAMVFSITLRFIPVTAEEFNRIRDAQSSRGASFGTGSVVQRIAAWRCVLIPLLVGLFRRADVLAQAMDARCYGAYGVKRTSLSRLAISASSVVVLILGSALCILLAVIA